MAFTFSKSFDLTSKIWPLLQQQLRYRNRPNLKNPLPMHYKRKRLYAVCEPVMPPKPPLCANTYEVPRNVFSVEDNPYALFLAGQMRRNFKKYPMVAIFHANHYTGRDYQETLGMLHDNNFRIRFNERLNPKIVQAALTGTKWAPVINLCPTAKTVLGFCEIPDVAKLTKLLRKIPFFILLGLVYEDKLLHRDDIDRVAKMSNILSLHSQLSTSLNLPMMNFSQNLMAGQMALSHSLSTYAKGVDGSSSSSDSSSDSSSSDSDNEK